MNLPEGDNAYRLVITEVEIYLRDDLLPSDPHYSVSRTDFSRERVVYADVFEL